MSVFRGMIKAIAYDLISIANFIAAAVGARRHLASGGSVARRAEHESISERDASGSFPPLAPCREAACRTDG